MNLRRLLVDKLVFGAIAAGLVFATPVAHARAASQPAVSALVLTRQGCYGRCPVDEVRFTSSGDVAYTGFRFVSQPGPYRGKIAPAAFNALVENVRHDGFFTFPGRFKSPATDVAEYTLTVEAHGATKTVSAAIGISKQADDIASTLDEARRATTLTPTLALQSLGGFYQAILPAAVYRARVDYGTDGTFTLEQTSYTRDPCYGQAVDPQVKTLTLISDGAHRARTEEEASTKFARTALGLRMTRPAETVDLQPIESDALQIHSFRDPLPSCELIFDLNNDDATAPAMPVLSIHATVQADEAALVAHAHFHPEGALGPEIPAKLVTSKFDRDAGWYYTFTPATALPSGNRFTFLIDRGVRAEPRGTPSEDFRCDATPHQ